MTKKRDIKIREAGPESSPGMVAYDPLRVSRETLGYEDSELYREDIARSVSRAVNRALNLGDAYGLDADIYNQIWTEKMALTLPTEDEQVALRLRITPLHRSRSVGAEVQAQPTLLLLKQIHRTIAAAYGDTFGFESADDHRVIARETFAFIMHYATAHMMVDQMYKNLPPGRRLFRQDQGRFGRAAFAAHFAHVLSLPDRGNYYESAVDDYIRSLKGWFRDVRAVLIEHNPNRVLELCDAITNGLEQPMSDDEVGLVFQTFQRQRLPIIHLVQK